MPDSMASYRRLSRKSVSVARWFNSASCARRRSVRSWRRSNTEARTSSRRSGCSKRSSMWLATRLSSFSMGIERPLQPVSPWRALIEQV
jgi:hypothetical protein